MSRFLTLEEAAERLGVEYKTVYRLVRAGDLPAGKVGRIYRIREDDLHAYFERQKGLLAEETRRTGLIALEGRRCGACDRQILSELSVAGRCEQCDRDICQACWAIRKVRRCAAHATASAAVQESQQELGPETGVTRNSGPPRATVRTATDPTREIARLQAEGKPVIVAAGVWLVAEGFLRAFAQRFEAIDELPDLLSRRDIALRAARVKHILEPDEHKGDRSPISRVSRFVLRVGGWGHPKAGLVLEARFVVRDQKLAASGYDADPLGEAELAPLLRELRERARAEDVFHVALVGSATGWDNVAQAAITRPTGGRAFHDRRVAVALQDLQRDQTYLNTEDERLREFWPLLAPARFGEELARCVARIRELAAKLSGIAIDHAARTLGVPRGWVRAAFAELVKTGQYVTSELPELGLVLSRRSA